jgi:hypothetical protein
MSMRALGLRLLQAAHRASLAPARRRFDAALVSVEATQHACLRRLIAANTRSCYGRAHRFDRVTSVLEWQDRVPLVSYDDLHPWVMRAASGEPAVLTSAPVRAFERTSGSTAPNKLVPYTGALLDEFSAATGPWLADLYTSCPDLAGTTSYWSISPAARTSDRTPGGIPIGFDDDTDYFSPLERFAIRRMMAVPPDVVRLTSLDDWADATARHLVAAGDLGLVSVWHPSFFLLLLDRIERRLEDLLADLPSRRASAIRGRRGRLTLGEALWPRLRVISCWADAAAETAVPALARALPQARLQPKGLLATEGAVTLPLERDGTSIRVAAVAGHFLEFVDLDRPSARPRLAHQLRAGGAYAPVISTGGGFYRYRLGDAVRCTGLHFQAPILTFLGRIDQVSDLCGEKLNPQVVAAALSAAGRATGARVSFSLLAPVPSTPPYYCLYVEGPDEGDLARLGDALDRALADAHGYRYARALGQLGSIRVVAVRDGASRYLRARAAAGQRAGQIKPVHLDASLDWRLVFEAGQELHSGSNVRLKPDATTSQVPGPKPQAPSPKPQAQRPEAPVR